MAPISRDPSPLAGRPPHGSRHRRSGLPRTAGRRPSWPSFAFNPLECAGAAMVLGCYLLEWTFRGYLDYHNLRTLSPYAIVPWYDVIPQIGAVLFAIGWWSGPRVRPGRRLPRPIDADRPARRPAPGPWAWRC